MSIEHNQETMERYIKELGIDGNNTKEIAEKLVLRNKRVEEEIQSLQEALQKAHSFRCGMDSNKY